MVTQVIVDDSRFSRASNRGPRAELVRCLDRPTLEVARGLLGWRLIHEVDGRVLSGRIVETEAYVGEEDLACHAARGRTARTEVMYGAPGHAYVYLIYGMYHCFNVVTEREGYPAAVLIRALEPDAGVADRTDGPGRLCRALGIHRGHTGANLIAGPLRIEPDPSPSDSSIAVSTRINVDYAGDWALRPWRFYLSESRHVSVRTAPGRQPRTPRERPGDRTGESR
ncbi:MAG: DNA-3-methyladenine glycosylase [Chloroflexota bacterium]